MKFLFLGEKVEGWGGSQIVASCVNILLLNPWNVKFMVFPSPRFILFLTRCLSLFENSDIQLNRLMKRQFNKFKLLNMLGCLNQFLIYS